MAKQAPWPTASCRLVGLGWASGAWPVSPQPETQAFLLPKPHTPVPKGGRGSPGWLPAQDGPPDSGQRATGHLSSGRSDHTHTPWTFIPTASSTLLSAPRTPQCTHLHMRAHTHTAPWNLACPKWSIFLGTGSGRGLDTLLGQLPQPLTHACPNPPHHPFKMQV